MARLPGRCFFGERADFCTKKGVFMGLRKVGAQAVSALSTVALKHVFRRPAANFPGKIALYVDPRIIAGFAGQASVRLDRGRRTNGKTTVSNLLADVVETAGHSVVCNRTGANLDSGVATALLHAQTSGLGRLRERRAVAGTLVAQLQANYVPAAELVPRPAGPLWGDRTASRTALSTRLAASPRTVLGLQRRTTRCAPPSPRVRRSCRSAPGTPSVAFGCGRRHGA